MPIDPNTPLFMFSIDLEDVRTMIPNGECYRPRVPAMTHLYLNFLRKHNAKCTFFIVGRTALENRSLIAEIISEGHEIACHTHTHQPLTEMTPDTFRDDLKQNIQALTDCGAKSITGFRAPTFSLVKATAWAYDVMAQQGIEYSSSVLPAKNPLFGWEEFGTAPRQVENGKVGIARDDSGAGGASGVVEIPMTLLTSRFLTAPFGGGVYFRALPWPVISRCFRRHNVRSSAVLSYFHPYDIDTEQERFMHPGIKNSRFYNWLMYRNRAAVFTRLERVLAMGYKIDTYSNFVQSRIVPLLN